MVSTAAEISTVRVEIHGRVQGVGYRFWTQAEAERLGISGHVRNRRDGAVEAVFSGPNSAVTSLIEACRLGPPGARIVDLHVAEHPDRPRPGFAILRD